MGCFMDQYSLCYFVIATAGGGQPLIVKDGWQMHDISSSLGSGLYSY